MNGKVKDAAEFAMLGLAAGFALFTTGVTLVLTAYRWREILPIPLEAAFALVGMGLGCIGGISWVIATLVEAFKNEWAEYEERASWGILMWLNPFTVFVLAPAAVLTSPLLLALWYYLKYRDAAALIKSKSAG